jgi:hypothetical protein
MPPQLSACKEQFIIRAKLEVHEKFLSRMHQKKNEATEEDTLAIYSKSFLLYQITNRPICSWCAQVLF